MATVQTLYLPHYPDFPVYISFFQNVTNANFLRQQLLDANAAFEYAFLDATMILSPRHLLAATFRALNDSVHSRLKSRNIHSELVFSLSPNNNIADSFRRFGIQDSTTTLIAVKIPLGNPLITAESVAKHLEDAVEGTSVEFGEEVLEGVTDVKALRKVYKLDSGNGGGGGGGKKGRKGKAEEVVVNGNGLGFGKDEKAEMESVILGIMALKGT